MYSIAVETEQGLSNLKGLSKPLYKNVRRALLSYFNKYLESPAPIPPKSKPQCTGCFLYTDEHTAETCPSQPRCFNWYALILGQNIVYYLEMFSFLATAPRTSNQNVQLMLFVLNVDRLDINKGTLY